MCKTVNVQTYSICKHVQIVSQTPSVNGKVLRHALECETAYFEANYTQSVLV